MSSELFKILEKLLELLKNSDQVKNYRVPSLWLRPNKEYPDTSEAINPYEFFLNRIQKIEELSKQLNRTQNVKQGLSDSIIYNMSVRHVSAYDNNSDGTIEVNPTESGFRETGTFLKAIAMLPYIASLGTNIIYLLPITSIGKDGRKGNLGSIYAVRNSYKIDENLSEPILGMKVEDQFKAFTEAARSLGIKVILEFVFRTASIDSDWALDHPEWFYWIREEIENRGLDDLSEYKYGAPIFTEVELDLINAKIKAGDMKRLLPPHKAYRSMFCDIPKKVTIENGKILGITKKNVRCRIPSAFADWPPNDTQPPWSDVTYLRLFDDEDYNYIAYNTVRMYDEKLSKKKNRVEKLWDKIADIIPYYQKEFLIDGVMIDMGHALPERLLEEIITRARKSNKDFIFWEENFHLSEKSVETGYNAVVGYMMFDEHVWWKLRNIIKVMATEGSPIPFFATPENHNTPRANARINNINYSKFAWTINSFIPAIPFIHAGYELGESFPVNTGLDFQPEELDKYPPELLSLFSIASLNWNSSNEWTHFLSRISGFRKEYLSGMNDEDYQKLIYVDHEVESLIAFIRKTNKDGRDLLIAGNIDPHNAIHIELKLPAEIESIHELIHGRKFDPVNPIRLSLEPFETVCCEIVFKDNIWAEPEEE